MTQSDIKYFVVIPSFDDNLSVQEICFELNQLPLSPQQIIVLDDSIGIDCYDDLPTNALVVSPSFRLGQQRLLTHFFRHEFTKCCDPSESDLIIIMDADGEDSPLDIKKLLDDFTNERPVDLVLATRTSRHSTIRFRLGYACFRFLSRLLTGETIKTGTFSISSWRWLQQACNHDAFNVSFVGGLLVAPASRKLTPIARQPRRYGSPKVNTSGLIQHGLGVFLAMSKQISVRFFTALCAVSFLSILLVITTLSLWWIGVTVPGYTSIILISVFQLNIIMLILFLGSIQNGRILSIQDAEIKFLIRA